MSFFTVFLIKSVPWAFTLGGGCFGSHLLTRNYSFMTDALTHSEASDATQVTLACFGLMYDIPMFTMRLTLGFVLGSVGGYRVGSYTRRYLTQRLLH
jgi:ABC-type Mn2+/Zn2+ transport system permease subunit